MIKEGVELAENHRLIIRIIIVCFEDIFVVDAITDALDFCSTHETFLAAHIGPDVCEFSATEFTVSIEVEFVENCLWICCTITIWEIIAFKCDTDSREFLFVEELVVVNVGSRECLVCLDF